MRLWSLHPHYFDSVALVACWREALLARAVLRGATFGYRHHPQLQRFCACDNPLLAIDCYLSGLHAEALQRGYSFDATKFGPCDPLLRLDVTDGQLLYELDWLRDKLNIRSPKCATAIRDIRQPVSHPFFRVINGAIEQWEVQR